MNNSNSIKVFIVEDDWEFAEELKKDLEASNENGSLTYDIKVFDTGDECVKELSVNPELVILDLKLPGMSGLELLQQVKQYNNEIKTIVLSGQKEVEQVIEVYKAGADDYLVKNEKYLDELEQAIHRLTNNIKLRKQVDKLKEQIVDRNKYSLILGGSPKLLEVLKLMQKVEKNDIMVLITGESGTGKELVARTIHYNSHRKNNAFIPINVPAIPEDLIESELFGHEKGAFTGAVNKRIGKFEEGDGGTIFLDEIGEMDLDLQAKLLRVLQENEVVRVGSNKIINIDVRVLASTNRDLLQEVKAGRFREDLYYRLNGFLIDLPPLRERGDDILLLAKNFLDDFCKRNKLPAKKISQGAAQTLLNYDWPGNIRELKSSIERAILLAETNEIQYNDLINCTTEE